MSDNAPPSAAPSIPSIEKSYSIRVARPDDLMAIVDLALRVRGVLHFPPSQLEWMLKQENSDFFTLLAYDSSGNTRIRGFLIGKKKQIQGEVLEIYAESESESRETTSGIKDARGIYRALLNDLVALSKRDGWEGLTALVPGADLDLREAFLDAAFYRAKIVEKYYVGGDSAELWIRSTSKKEAAIDTSNAASEEI